MAYFWMTEAKKYIQSLGFGSTRPPVNRSRRTSASNEWGLDNSFETTRSEALTSSASVRAASTTPRTRK